MIPTTSETCASNAAFNSTMPTSSQLSSYASEGYAYEWVNGSFNDDTFLTHVDGQYTGSTDMIMRWSACKWGIDENIVRAVGWNESHWNQGGAGDPRPIPPSTSPDPTDCIQDQPNPPFRWVSATTI